MNKLQKNAFTLIKAGFGLIALAILLPIAFYLMIAIYSLITTI